jgi:hypothetical protein
MKRNYVGTIGDQVRRGHTLTLICESCHHRVDMHVTALVEENGKARPGPAVGAFGSCSFLGGRLSR